MKVPKSKFFIFKIILICSLSYLNRSSFFIFYQTNKNITHNDFNTKAPKDILIHLEHRGGTGAEDNSGFRQIQNQSADR